MYLFPQAVFRERVQFSEHQVKEERSKLNFVLGSWSANSVFMLEAMMPPFTFNSTSLWELRFPSLLSYNQTWGQWDEGPILCQGTAVIHSLIHSHYIKGSRLGCASLSALESGDPLWKLIYWTNCHLPPALCATFFGSWLNSRDPSFPLCGVGFILSSSKVAVMHNWCAQQEWYDALTPCLPRVKALSLSSVS